MRLVAYNSCEDLLAKLRQSTAERVTPYGLDQGGLLQDLRGGPMPANGDARAAAPEVGGQGGQKPADTSHSGTNVHEVGADEPDLVKTDGRRIVVLAQGRLHVIDPATRRRVHELKLPGEYGGASHLLLSGDRALVIANAMSAMPMVEGDVYRPSGFGARMSMLLVDLAGAPKVVGSMTGAADYVDARQTGSVARIIVRSTPRIEFPRNRDPLRSPQGAIERNRRVVKSAPIEAWLPRFTSGGRDYQVPCERVSSPSGSPGASMLSVLTVDLGKDLGDPTPISVAADGQTVYGNGSSLYVTGTQWQGPRPWSQRPPDTVDENNTDIHRFDVSGSGPPRYVASGSVRGELINQYALSEYGGYLRVATTTTPQWSERSRQRSQSAVHVLRQSGARLDGVGKIDGLGKGERIYSVRFLGATAYVVTFRQVDPLYVVDLRDPRKPAVTGELKIKGYSAYLHPMADGRLLGVGQDATGEGRTLGTQVSLFDVSGKPRRLSVFRLPGSSSQSEFDPHAFLYWPDSGLTVLPVDDHQGGSSALVLTVGSGAVRQLGSIQHPQRDVQGIQRSLVVGGTLWTVSEGGARASDLSTLADRGWVEF